MTRITMSLITLGSMLSASAALAQGQIQYEYTISNCNQGSIRIQVQEYKNGMRIMTRCNAPSVTTNPTASNSLTTGAFLTGVVPVSFVPVASIPTFAITQNQLTTGALTTSGFNTGNLQWIQPTFQVAQPTQFQLVSPQTHIISGFSPGQFTTGTAPTLYVAGDSTRTTAGGGRPGRPPVTEPNPQIPPVNPPAPEKEPKKDFKPVVDSAPPSTTNATVIVISGGSVVIIQ